MLLRLAYIGYSCCISLPPDYVWVQGSDTGNYQEVAWFSSVQFSSFQSLSCVQVFATPWIAARQASLSITNSWSSLKPTSIELVMLSSHLILCRPLLLLPPIPPSITVFSNESTLRMRWSKYWSFSFNISPSKEHPGLISFRRNLLAWLDLLAWLLWEITNYLCHWMRPK